MAKIGQQVMFGQVPAYRVARLDPIEAAPPRMKGRPQVPRVALATVFLTLLVGTAQAATPERAFENQHTIRFEFDNDIFLGSDDAFTAGWSLQLHSPMLDTWRGAVPRALGRLPGLGDDGPGGRTVRWALGLSQIIVTPRDLSVAQPQPDDAPWAGVLGTHGTLASFDNRRLVAVQLYLGCMGPCSQAEGVQNFVHDNIRGDPPAGWANQLDTRYLANVNVAGRYKLFAPTSSAYAAGRFASDLSLGGQVGAGNFATFVQGQIEWRFGRGLPMGFTHIPDPPPFGVALDPVYSNREDATWDPRRWRSYGSVVVRLARYERVAIADGGRTANGGEHPGIEPSLGDPEILLGLHAGRAPVAFHATYYRYLAGRREVGRGSSLDWINLSLEVRF